MTETRLLVTGSHTLTSPADRDLVRETLKAWLANPDLGPVRLIVGDAQGPDAFALEWARDWNLPAARYAADWVSRGRGAGPERNATMLAHGRPSEAIAFWDGRSPGTLDCLTRCVRHGVPVRVVACPRLRGTTSRQTVLPSLDTTS